jgi:UTP--glucose-1-phosphate uridylyltransferase
MKAKITKAVFPVAGMGTRFLPATKAMPKEMLPVVDKPLIQYAVEEAIAAGIKEMVFITGRNKRAIEDHFDKAYELETELETRGKADLLALVREVGGPGINCIYVRQSQALGLGHAVLCARPVIGEQPFAVILADDLMDAQPSVLQQMTGLFETHGHSVLAVQNIPREHTSSYGIVATTQMSSRLYRINQIVEKPAPDVAPSTLAVAGRYLLTPEIFPLLARTVPGKGGEIQLTDAIATLLSQQQVMAWEFEGLRHDCGTKLGYLQANILYGMRHAEVGAELREFVRGLNIA